MLWNLEQLRTEIWQHLGEPSDLDPSSDTQYNSGPLLDLIVNEGQREVAAWSDPVSNQRLRVRNLYSDLFFQAITITGILDADAPADNQVTFPAADVGNQADRYNGWMVENTTTGESRLIVDYNGNTATVHKDWSTNPVSTDEYAIYKRFFILTDGSDPWQADHIVIPTQSSRYRQEGNFLEILKISDLDQEQEITLAGRAEDFLSTQTSIGDPGEYYVQGNKLVMNQNIDDDRWFKMEYYRLPTDLSADTDYPEIPEIFHYGIVLWALWWGTKRDGEASLAYSAKRDFIDFMRRNIDTYKVQFDRVEVHGSLQKE